MKPLMVRICAFFCFPVSVLADNETIATHFSKRYEAVHDGQTLVLLLEKNDKTLRGQCYNPLQQAMLSIDGNYDDNSSKIECSQTRIDADGNYQSDVWLQGKLHDLQIDGVWFPKAKSPAISLVWKEIYPAGSVATNVVHLQTQSTRAHDEKRIGQEVQCRYLQVMGKDPAYSRINGQLRQLAYNASVIDKKERSKAIPTAADVEARVWAQIEDSEYDWKDAYLDEFVYAQELVFDEKNLLCIRESTYTYSGGAHGYQHNVYHVFSLVSGDHLTLNDVMKPGYMTDFVAWGRADLLRQAGAQPGQSLVEAGLEKDELKLNGNWWIDAKGLGFSYAPYEIACYARGTVEFQVPWTQLQPWIDPEAALQPMVEKK